MDYRNKMTGMDTIVKSSAIIVAAAMLIGFTMSEAAENYKFDFGDGPVAAGYTQIKANTKYSDSQGYGFESGSVSSVDRLWDDDLTTDFLTANGDMVFSVKLPQGNYEVTFILGDGENESETTVWAENRKLMLDRVTLAGGVFSRQTVSLRRMETKSMDGSVTMSIKDREKDYRTWDQKLTFVITGRAPAVAGIEIKRNDNVTTLWLCGNSTVVDQIMGPWAGWGQMAPGFFKSSLAIANYAESGLTASGFYNMKRLKKILAEVKKGDYVTVQFAHNDQKNQNDVNNYEATLTKYANEIKAKGATPLFITSTARQSETDPKTAVGGLPERMRALGKKIGVTVLDLNQHSITLGKALGNNKEKMYMYTAKDKTHFCEYGAYELARANIEEMKAKVPELAKHLRDDHVAFDSNKPDPLDVLTQKKAPITTGGLIQVDPEPESSASSEEPTLSSSSQTETSASSDGSLQAEDGTMANEAVLESKHGGFKGTGYVNFAAVENSSVTIPVDVAAEGAYTVTLRYALGGNNESRALTIASDKTAPKELTFANTGDWTEWKEVETTVDLPAGKSNIVIATVQGNDGPNLDEIKVIGTSVADTGTQSIAGVKLNALGISGTIRSNTLSLNGMPVDGATVSIFDMQGIRMASFNNVQGNEIQISLRQGAYLVKVSQGNRTLGIFKAHKH